MNIKNKNVLVYGLSSSGEWATKLLLKLKANIFCMMTIWTNLKLSRSKIVF